MSYYSQSQKARSEKITMVTACSTQKLKLFTEDGGKYRRVVNHFISSVKYNSLTLTQSASLPVSSNHFFFDAPAMTLYVNVGENPKLGDLVVTYKHFFSTAPVIAPYDFSSGHEVEWLPIIQSIGQLGQQLDDENTGIVLESSSNVKLINRDGYFDGIFDKLIWENQEILFYSFIDGLPYSQRTLLFDGVIESKSYADDSITFTVKDFVYKLKNKVNLSSFSSLDGIMIPSLIGTPKRRIYGRADTVKCSSLDATLDGFSISGTISGSVGSKTITGVGTSFLDQVSPSDELFFTISGTEYKLGVDSITSNTSLEISKESEIAFSGISAINKPQIAWRKKNRDWHLAGHKLISPSVQITSIIALNNFIVADSTSYIKQIQIKVNGIQTTIRAISADHVITATNIVPAPSIGSLIVKRAVKNVYFGNKSLVFERDYDYTNTTEAKIVLDELAEFNITEPRLLDIEMDFDFPNTHNFIFTVATIDLRTIVKPRDWVRSALVTEPEWYEVLAVEEQKIYFRSNTIAAKAKKGIYYKNVEYIDENSLITADCLGMESESKWIRSASDAVRHLVKNDSGFTSVNEASFTKAKKDCDFILSMVIPENIGGSAPIIRDVISKINESVFGSLYGNSSQQISYSIVNSQKPESSNVIQDDDIISFSVSSTQKIINKCKVNYRPYIDIYSGQDGFKSINQSSSFVDEMIGISNTLEKTIYLYEDDKARVIAQRLCLFNSLSNSTVVIKSKINLSHLVVNDKVHLSLDRLYRRYGGLQSQRIGVVSGVKKDGFSCEVSINDLGNIYSRVMSIAPNASTDFTLADDGDKIKWGYVLDNDTKTPDIASEEEIGSNLVG